MKWTLHHRIPIHQLWRNHGRLVLSVLGPPWVYLDLNDDGAIQGRMHLRQMDSKQRLNIDENGLEVSSAEPGRDGEHRVVARLGEKYPCRLRGIDIWGGSLDLAPK